MLVVGSMKSTVLSPPGIATWPRSTGVAPGPPLTRRFAVVAGPLLLMSTRRPPLAVDMRMRCAGDMPRLLNSAQRCFSGPDTVQMTGFATLPAGISSETALLAVPMLCAVILSILPGVAGIEKCDDSLPEWNVDRIGVPAAVPGVGPRSYVWVAPPAVPVKTWIGLVEGS